MDGQVMPGPSRLHFSLRRPLSGARGTECPGSASSRRAGSCVATFSHIPAAFLIMRASDMLFSSRVAATPSDDMFHVIYIGYYRLYAL